MYRGENNLVSPFGLLHIACGIEDVLYGVCRVLKPDGTLLFEKAKGSEKRLIEMVEAGVCVFRETGETIFTKEIERRTNHGQTGTGSPFQTHGSRLQIAGHLSPPAETS